MRGNRIFASMVAIGAAACLSQTAVRAATLSMSATYFTVAESGDPDFNTNPCCSSYYTNEVESTLGPDGLPVYNSAYGGPTLYDLNASGELTWWSPSENSNVTATGTGTVTLPYANYSMFPPNGTGSSDSNGFQAAIFRGTLVVPVAESVTFSFGADDDAFLALGDTVISQEGGIHGVSAAPVTTSVLAPGDYALTLFYTDRHVTGAGLYFSVDTANVSVGPTSAVPEPSTWAMLLAGFGGLGLVAYRRGRNLTAA
jgi:PEP-CTERM motif-containing protein